MSLYNNIYAKRLNIAYLVEITGKNSILYA